ncbi:MAG: hypothetical protein FD129_2208, partial [bacterium]
MSPRTVRLEDVAIRPVAIPALSKEVTDSLARAMPWQTGTGTDDHVPPYPAQTVIPYHDIAGVTPDNTVILHLGPGTEKRAYRLIDGYCDNPDCAGSE